MNIYLIKNGQNSGPYSATEVRSRVKSGSFTLDDLAWFEGCTEPIPLAQVLAKAKPVRSAKPETPMSKPTPAGQSHSAEELSQIADLYKKFLILGAAWLLYCFIPVPESLHALVSILGLVSLGYWLRFNWKLSGLLRKNPWVWTLLVFIPVVNFIAWGRILWLAAQTLRANGVPCGIMGTDQAALNRRRKTV